MHRTLMRTALPGPQAPSQQARFPLPLSLPTPSHPLTVCVYWDCNVSSLPLSLVVFSFFPPPPSSTAIKPSQNYKLYGSERVTSQCHSQQEKVNPLSEVSIWKGWQWVTQVLAVYSSLRGSHSWVTRRDWTGLHPLWHTLVLSASLELLTLIVKIYQSHKTQIRGLSAAEGMSGSWRHSVWQQYLGQRKSFSWLECVPF